MKTHYSCAELAAMKLPGLPTTERAIQITAARESWPKIKRSGRGGGWEYPATCLPNSARNALLMHHFTQEETHHEQTHSIATAAQSGTPGQAQPRIRIHLAEALADPGRGSAETALQPVSQQRPPARRAAAQGQDGAGTRGLVTVCNADADDLNSHQREVAAAQARIVRFVADFAGSAQAAIDHLNGLRAVGTLPVPLAWAYDHAWDKPRKNQRINLSTLNNWKAVKKQRGSHAPMRRKQDLSVQPWHMLAVALRQRPQGSSFKWIEEQLRAQNHAVSYDQVTRFFRDKFSQLDQIKGRYTGSQLRSHKFYQHRTADGLAPADMIHADGWNTHFTAPHPVTGEFVTYEVWHFHDVATRYVTAPGIGLTENAEVIARGLENCIRELGVINHLQTDSTKVVKGSERFTKAMHSLEERLGFTWTHPKEVGNSQANGIAENFNTSWLDKCSRELATYQNKNSMDDLTFKRVKKLTAAMVKAANAGDKALRLAKKNEAERMGKGRVFDSYQQALEWINRIVSKFNDRPHRSLPKIADPATGRKRHQTPREALAEHRANGWEPEALDETELIDAFRPHVVVKVTRETVSPYGGMRYRNPEVLGHWNGKQVVVAYDIHDYSQVWVKDLKGLLICVAEFVSATGYAAKTALEDGDEKRTLATLRRIEKKRETVLARNPVMAIECQGDGLVPFKFEAAPAEETLIVIKPEAPAEPEAEVSYMDTIAMLRKWQEESDGEKTEEEVAASS